MLVGKIPARGPVQGPRAAWGFLVMIRFLTPRRKVLWFACAVLSFLVPSALLSPKVSAQGKKEIDWAMLLPDEPGKEFVTAWCVGCHSLAHMVVGKRNKDAWYGSVGAMIGEYNAPIPEEDTEAIADYLARVSGENNPVSEVPMDVNSAPPAALKRLKFLNGQQIDAIVQQRSKSKFSSMQDVHKLLKLNPEQAELCDTYLQVG